MHKQTVKLCGLIKADIEKKLEGFKTDGVSFAVSERAYDAEITVEAEDTLSERSFGELLTRVFEPFKSFIYAEYAVKPAEMAVTLLLRSKNVLSTAESLTGGALAASIIEYPGVSACFYEGVVAYDNGAKKNRLGVTQSVLNSFGAVSEECARQMVDGLLSAGKTTVALSTTGVAGPSGGSDRKPVGTVYIGIGDKSHTEAFRHVFAGDRDAVREATVNTALFYLVKYLRGGMYSLLV
ncbi:MAG: nicotinamide-nucleotide amidohydrolase family protein [Clostridiaceae bacterium]|jgi:nicotinamide-nucleotide amidase|nr:nicotinamide-nucleotide amidohydrolase family protein [Clostridiaceae bacterium]